MHLLAKGTVRVDDQWGSGILLLTERSIYAFRARIEAVSAAHAAGGLLGPIGPALALLVGWWIHRARGPKRPPPHFDNPEIAGLEESERKPLTEMELAAHLPLDSNLSVESNWTGFVFRLGPTVVKFSGWGRLKEIARFLDTHGVRINRS